MNSDKWKVIIKQRREHGSEFSNSAGADVFRFDNENDARVVYDTFKARIGIPFDGWVIYKVLLKRPRQAEGGHPEG